MLGEVEEDDRVGIEPPLVRLLYWTGKRLISHLSPIDGVQRRVS